MNSADRKVVSVITKYAVESFAESDWHTLGQITGKLHVINDHPRLLRAYTFGDIDYDYCAAEVLDSIFTEDRSLISEVVDFFDIDLWFEQKDPAKHQRIFRASQKKTADFWTEGYLKLFVSHISANREKMSALKKSLSRWGISAFIAHEDIEASREWRDEVEAGLDTMEVLAAVVEPGFKESDWCPQEVGYALGRSIDIVPLRAGQDPFGFFGKIQGIQIKGKVPDTVAKELTHLLLKKPKFRNGLLQSLIRAFVTHSSPLKIKMTQELDSWSILADEQMTILIESISLSKYEMTSLDPIIKRVGAFKPIAKNETREEVDDLPF